MNEVRIEQEKPIKRVNHELVDKIVLSYSYQELVEMELSDSEL